MLMAVITLLLGVFVMLLDHFVIKGRPKYGWFPTCVKDGNVMVKVPPTKDMPDKIKQYLTTYDLPKRVLQKYVCRKCGRELWIAPQIESMNKRLFVGRKA